MIRTTSTTSSFMKLATILILATLQTVSAHFEIVYPAWRGNTLKDDLQWNYPCGGKSVTTNRTNWPISGGALSIIPGWNAGHPTAFLYINMGFGSEPPNMTNVISPVIQMVGPSRDPFPGFICFDDLPLPKNANVKPGDNATIQVIQVALHGASLYNCADITFVEDGQEDPIPEGVCENSTTIGFNLVYTTSDAWHTVSPLNLATLGFFAVLTVLASLWLS